jgi:hypothetical protein
VEQQVADNAVALRKVVDRPVVADQAVEDVN